MCVWGGMLPDFFFCSLFPVQQTTSGIGNRIKYFFRVGNQYAECEKQQTTTIEGQATSCLSEDSTIRYHLEIV